MMPSSSFSFGQWLPDLPFYKNPGLVEALNCVPVDGYYKNYSPIATLPADATIGARAQGAFAAIDATGSVAVYVGTATKLKVKNGAAWTDLSGSTYTAATTDYWRFAQFDNYVFATDHADIIQYATIGSSTFGNVGGGAPDPAMPKARHIAKINRFIMVGDTVDAINGTVPYRVQWTGIDLPLRWFTPNSAEAIANQAGQQFLSSSQGPVTGIFAGDQMGIIGQRTGLTRATYAGSPIVFQFDNYETGRGIWFPNASVQIGQFVYFISHDGFYVTDGVSVKAIGNGKVDKTFLAECDQTYKERVYGAFDFQSKCIYWSYPSTTAVTGTPDRVIIYSFVEDRWSHSQDLMTLVFPSYSTGYTLDQLDTISTSIDGIQITLDSTFWQGGLRVINGFGTDNRLGTFSGTSGIAQFESSEIEPVAMGYFFVNAVDPQVTGAPSAITAQIGYRDTQDNASRTWTPVLTRTTRSGLCDCRVTFRYGSVRLNATGNFDRALGFQLRGVPAGAL